MSNTNLSDGAKGIFWSGVAFFALHFWINYSPVMAALFNNKVQLVTLELLSVNERKRVKVDGPPVYNYRTSENGLIALSLTKLEGGSIVSCFRFESNCYVAGKEGAMSFVRKGDVAMLYMSPLMILLGLVMFMYIRVKKQGEFKSGT
ncbi:MAG: hypothetical protein ABJH06_09290 [Paraglaciecola sp.]|uniref:hypothetical protein n=1 Tax=Paraglaciecola sp. TaxID=1920173 RepID=UPI003297DC36